MSETRQLSLSQSAQFDFTSKHKLSKWGQISADRAKQGISRRQRVLKNKAKRNTT